jgi:uncharacterized protein (DUF58 family)
LLGAAAMTVIAGAGPVPALLAVAVGLAVVTAGACGVMTIAIRRMAITRFVAVREAREDEPIRLRFEVTGLGRLPVALEVQTAAGVWLPLSPQGGSVELLVGRRGRHRLGPSQVRVRDALGIFERRSAAGRHEPLLILPAPDNRLAGAPPGGRRAGLEDEPEGVRPYTPGTPLSRIHWPALARGAGLHVRYLAPGPEALPLVLVDTDGDHGPTALDWVARAAAGWILHLVRAGGCKVLLPGDRTATTVTSAVEWRAVHRRLALIQRCGSAVPPGASGRTVRIAAAAATALAPLAVLPPGVEPVPWR